MVILKNLESNLVINFFNFMLVNLIVLIFITTLLYIGLKTKSKSNETSYLFIGRKLTLFPFIATLVSTWYGGILEIGRFSHQNGIVTWIIFGFSYYIFFEGQSSGAASSNIGTGVVGTSTEYAAGTQGTAYHYKVISCGAGFNRPTGNNPAALEQMVTVEARVRLSN